MPNITKGLSNPSEFRLFIDPFPVLASPIQEVVTPSISFVVEAHTLAELETEEPIMDVTAVEPVASAVTIVETLPGFWLEVPPDMAELLCPEDPRVVNGPFTDVPILVP